MDAIITLRQCVTQYLLLAVLMRKSCTTNKNAFAGVMRDFCNVNKEFLKPWQHTSAGLSRELQSWDQT